jgi:Voltage-dependent anion channel
MPFNLGCWGFTFPLGVYSLATLALAHATRLGFFSVLGGALVVCLTALWLIVAVLTIVGAWDGQLLVARPPGRGSASKRVAQLTDITGAERSTNGISAINP